MAPVSDLDLNATGFGNSLGPNGDRSFNELLGSATSLVRLYAVFIGCRKIHLVVMHAHFKLPKVTLAVCLSATLSGAC